MAGAPMPLDMQGGITFAEIVKSLFKSSKKLTKESCQKKPHSAITVQIENLTADRFQEDDVGGIPDLVEVIGLQATGPTEAARAIRKKLKYGDVHRQLRALVILDGLIQNAGGRFQRTFADEPLLERLRFCGTSETSDPLVKKKCGELFRSWAAEYKNTRGLEQISALYKQLPRRKQAVTKDTSKVLRETEQNPFEVDEDKEEETPPTPAPSHSRQSSLAEPRRSSTSSPSSFFGSSKSKKDKKKSKGKSKPFNLEAEKGEMKNCIAEASVASTNLLNALRLINREQEQVSENQNAVRHFETCKLLRRKILRYIHNIEAEQWLGPLIVANDQLISSLITFEQLDRSIDADSDSDDEMAEQAHLYKMSTEQGKDGEAAQQLAGLHIEGGGKSPEQRPPQPPRPTLPPPEEDDEFEDENDPFADRNAISTPMVEKHEPSWREV